MKNNQQPTDYKKMFMMGVIFMGAGVAFMVAIGPVGIGLMALGGIMMLVGGQHKDEWKND